MARPGKAKAIQHLQKALERIPELKQQKHGSQGFKKWQRDTRVTIENVFVDEPQKVAEFTDIIYYEISFVPLPESAHQEAYLAGLKSATTVLESMIKEIKDYWEDEYHEPKPSPIPENSPPNTKKVFVIHGRDNETKEIVARFLEHLELKPIILHEQSNQGRTIIEKFEQHAQVSFAIALLTPDDVGALQEEVENLKSRPRQNVIFEFGYFIGRLGRKRVCALAKGGVDILSDYAGVIYISLDNEGWKMDLFKELKDAGMDVNTKRAF